LNRNDNGDIEVKDFLNFINIKVCKAIPVPPVNPKKTQFTAENEHARLIDWKRFISHVGLEEDLQICGN